MEAALDVAEVTRRGRDPCAEIVALAGRLAQVTARDLRGGQAVEFGSGDADWPGIIGALLTVDYIGILTVAPAGRSRAELTRSRVLLGASG